MLVAEVWLILGIGQGNISLAWRSEQYRLS